MKMQIGHNKRAFGQAGFTMIELMIALLITSTLAIFIFKTFSDQSGTMQAQQIKASLQTQTRLSLEALRNLIQEAGQDPCHNGYFHAYEDNDRFAFLTVHPWGTPLGNFANPVYVPDNPFQAFVLHRDELVNMAGGTPNCRGQRLAHDPAKGLEHYRPRFTMPNGQVANGTVVFVNSNSDSDGGSLFLSCSNKGAQELLAVPILLVGGSSNPQYQLRCQFAQTIAHNVLCMQVDYFYPHAVECATVAGVEVGYDPQRGDCKVTLETYENYRAYNRINTVQITLWRQSDTLDKTYNVGENVRPSCIDGSQHTIPLGHAISADSQYRYTRMQTTINLSNLSFQQSSN